MGWMPTMFHGETSDRGDTLVEAAAAALILGLAAVALTAVAQTISMTVTEDNLRAEANFAAQYIEAEVMQQSLSQRVRYLDELAADSGRPVDAVFPDAKPQFPSSLYFSVTELSWVTDCDMVTGNCRTKADPTVSALPPGYSLVSQAASAAVNGLTVPGVVTLVPQAQPYEVTVYWRRSS